MEKFRLRAIEKNTNYRRIGRLDRIPPFIDVPLMLRRFLDWHVKDPIHNLFDGKLLAKGRQNKLWMINDVLARIGLIKKGPATVINARVTRETFVDVRRWCATPPPVLKLQFWGWSRDEVLSFVRGYRRFKMEQEYDIVVPTGLDQYFA